MNVQHYKNLILPLLTESFDEREAGNLFKIVLEDYFKKKFFEVKDLFLTDDEVEELNFIYEKICSHYPVQYIFNKAYFYGLELYVDEHVLIPRPETEELVDWIVTEFSGEQLLSVLDIGTGSGCIAIALKKLRPHWNVSGMDISEEAMKVAHHNALRCGTDVTFYHGDIRSEIMQQDKLDIIVSNPPYIPFREREQMSVSTLLHEPGLALFVEDKHPLLYYEAVASFAVNNLNDDGKLFFELNEFHAKDVKHLLEKKGFHTIVLKKDLAGKNRMIACSK